MDESIEKVIHTLNLIEVRGAENMSMMLGCIQELQKLKESDTE